MLDDFDSFISGSFAIIKYCKSTQVRSTALQQITADFDQDMTSPGNHVTASFSVYTYMHKT